MRLWPAEMSHLYVLSKCSGAVQWPHLEGYPGSHELSAPGSKESCLNVGVALLHSIFEHRHCGGGFDAYIFLIDGTSDS